MRGGATTSALAPALPERRGLRCLEGKCENAARYLRAAFTAARPSAFGEALKAAATPFLAAGACMRASSPSNCPFKASRLRERSPARASNSSTEIRMARAASCLVIATAPLRIACSNTAPNSFLNRVAGTASISTSSPSLLRNVSALMAGLNLSSRYAHYILIRHFVHIGQASVGRGVRGHFYADRVGVKPPSIA